MVDINEDILGVMCESDKEYPEMFFNWLYKT